MSIADRILVIWKEVIKRICPFQNMSNFDSNSKAQHNGIVAQFLIFDFRLRILKISKISSA